MSVFEACLHTVLHDGTEERFELRPGFEAALLAVLHEQLQGPNAALEVDRALRLMLDLEGPMESPSAGAGLRAMLAGDPQIVAFLRASRGSGRRIDGVLQHLLREGRAEALAAPMHDAPSEGVKLSDLIGPGASAPRDRPKRGASTRRGVLLAPGPPPGDREPEG